MEIFLWDHNKERVYEWMRDIIDPETDGLVAGAAFHWYSGDHFEALDLARRRFPDKKLIISESCIEFSKFGGEDALQSALRLSHEIIGDLNHGMTAFYDWNLLLDERGGPNHVARRRSSGRWSSYRPAGTRGTASAPGGGPPPPRRGRARGMTL